MAEFESDYKNSPGVHHFEMSGGQAIDVVSANDWSTFDGLLRATEFNSDSIALTPELMTSPQPLAEIPAMADVICRRLVGVQLFSAIHPETTFMLGSATPRQKLGQEIGNDLIPDFLNSLVFIKDIVRTGIAHKRKLIHLNELAVFDDISPKAPYGLLEKGIAAVVSSDLIMAANEGRKAFPAKVPYIDQSAHTVLVSACWAGQFPAPTGRVEEKRYREPLEQTVGMVFDFYPTVNDIVIADRIAPHRAKQPFNAHFRRTA